MTNYNYKCVVARNGNKQYYKSVGGKWKRISNKSGMKAEKGKRKYSGVGSSKPVPGQLPCGTGYHLDSDNQTCYKGPARAESPRVTVGGHWRGDKWIEPYKREPAGNRATDLEQLGSKPGW